MEPGRRISTLALFQVVVHGKVLEAILHHAASDLEHEVGGILLGRVEFRPDVLSVEVTDIIKARYTIATRTSITFTAETWIDITSQRKAGFRGKKTVGWYHSHLGLPPFWSALDQNFHWCLFQREPWYVAVVVDPICKEWKLFAWHNGQIVPWSSVVVQSACA